MVNSAFTNSILALKRIMEPLRYYLGALEGLDQMFADLGWRIEGQLPEVGDLVSLLDELEALETPTHWEDYLTLFQKCRAFLDAAKQLYSRLQDLPEALADEIRREFPSRLMNRLLVSYLGTYQQTLLAVLSFFEIAKLTEHEFTDAQDGFTEIRIEWENLGKAITKPGDLLRTIYKWGSADESLDGELLIEKLRAIGLGCGIPVEMDSAATFPAEKLFYPDPETPNEEFLASVPLIRAPFLAIADPDVGFFTAGLEILPIPDRDADPTTLKGLAILPYSQGAPALTFQLSDSLSFTITGTLEAGFAITILPPDRVSIVRDLLGTAGTEAALTIALQHQQAQGKFIVFGKPESSRLDYGSLSITAGLATTQSETDFLFETAIRQAALIIEAGEGDGFLQRLLPSDPITIDFDLTLGWSTKKGFYISGGAGFEYTFPINKELGPFFVNTVDLGLYLDQEGLRLMTAITGGASIGPVTATVRKIGLQAEVQFGKPGLLGKADLAFAFKPPTGVGLAINAPPLSGGGSLTIEPPIYFGALELSIQDTIGLKAFALIATKLPDGSNGFSMVIEIISEFTPIQLGYGFALSGVGGLLGINRQMSQDGLVAAFKSHSLDAIMFPPSPIKDAALIQQSIESIFPIKVSHHVIGPMVQIIWGGTVKLVTFQVGIFIEFGGAVRIAIIGQAKAALPAPEAPVLELNLDVLGFIDFGNETLSIDAALFNSHLLFLQLDGAMALRASWGDDANFALSVGGFHPRFTPPANFPSLQRLAVTLGEGNPHISLSSYIAITTNTIQLGALLDLYASKAGFVVTAGLGFDALVILHPFYFEFTTEAWASVSFEDTELASIALALMLTGPNPFHATGSAKFKVLFITIKAHFDATFGDPVGDQPPMVSPLDRLLLELSDPRNVRSELPAWASDGVVLSESNTPMLDPGGTRIFSQNAVPFNIRMERFGGGVPPAEESLLNLRLIIDAATAGTTANAQAAGDRDSDVEFTRFAPEQFYNWTAKQKLSAPAFEDYASGLRCRAVPYDPGAVEHIEVRFETILHESAEYEPPSPPPHPERGMLLERAFIPDGERLRGWAAQGATLLFNPLRTVRDPKSPGYVSLRPSTYVASSQDSTGGRFNPLPGATPTTYVNALRRMNGATTGSAVLLESAFVNEGNS